MHYILWLSRHDFSISLQNERHWSKTNVGVTSGRGPAWSQCTTHAPTPSRPLEARLQKCMRPMCTLNVHTRPALQRHGPSCEGVPTRIRQSGGMTASGQANAGVGHSFGSGASTQGHYGLRGQQTWTHHMCGCVFCRTRAERQLCVHAVAEIHDPTLPCKVLGQDGYTETIATG